MPSFRENEAPFKGEVDDGFKATLQAIIRGKVDIENIIHSLWGGSDMKG